MDRIYNYLGEDITGIKVRLQSDDFGSTDENNVPHVVWGEESDICDSNGFDKTWRPIKGSDVYVIDHYIIPKGTIICRYGRPAGRFTTIKGAVYETLSLPYVKETIEYHEYKVSENTMVDCYVKKGIVAPKFKSTGGAIQFMHAQSVSEECEDGFLEEVFEWRQGK